ncbi:pentapeptide repeat-containing protein [Chitinophaga sp. S165]|uniref:pentapeptide repeat-containing protein n=1 Tax=Chitinophaga sp. S165 TaxID=2135462 RepID=UPI000D718A6D|nr:pentapeptide repeat-containing protein [Chitinophaga sp. S165]PWV51885.1 pentapeptide repeat protein [Chitinophaga sp. S165]
MNSVTKEELYTRIQNYHLYVLGEREEDDDLNELIADEIEIADIRLEEIYAAGSLFSNCKISAVDFYGAHFHKTTFRNCVVVDSVFRKADLGSTRFENCRFDNCDLSRSEFMNARIERCTFENCDFSGIIFTGNNITDSTFKSINVRDGVLKRNEELRVEWQTYES